MKNRQGRSFTPATIDLGRRVIQEVKKQRIIGRSTLEKMFGTRYGGLQNVLIYITDVESHIAETDDGKLIWVE
jgi:hypothetical protein